MRPLGRQRNRRLTLRRGFARHWVVATPVTTQCRRRPNGPRSRAHRLEPGRCLKHPLSHSFRRKMERHKGIGRSEHQHSPRGEMLLHSARQSIGLILNFCWPLRKNLREHLYTALVYLASRPKRSWKFYSNI